MRPVSIDAKALRPRVLLLASRYDLACDYVVAHLRRKSVSYLRLNTEDLSDLVVDLDPVRRDLTIAAGDRVYFLTPESLFSVLFRRPVFMRDYGDDRRSIGQRFSVIQWSAFVRNLMLFEEARWINSPSATYRAEHKALQLSVAARLGFAVPDTRITNAPHPKSLGDRCGCVAVKGLDTVLLRTAGDELFGFTTFESPENLPSHSWRSAPATIQQALTKKLDIRVTVVGKHVFAAAITADGLPIVGDWRERKQSANFSRFPLPSETADKCRALVEALGLMFGAIDLALCEGQYYFLEINPTDRKSVV